MAKVMRQVIKIDEELCNGCGECVPACAEGAIQIIDGKARLVADKYCDGLGACLGECPMGAISFEDREAEAFDEAAVEDHLKSIGREPLHKAPEAPAAAPHHHGGGCPSARMFDFRTETSAPAGGGSDVRLETELRQWPVKLSLVNPSAPYFEDADLLIAADCTAFAYASVHPDFMRGKAIAIGCPKFEDVNSYIEKLTLILARNNIKSITALHMEVPCCFGLVHAVREAVAASGKDLDIQTKVVTLRGEITEPKGVASLF